MRTLEEKMKSQNALIFAVLLLAASAVQAQTYPNKPIRVIVPYAAGGTSDILARQIGPKLTEAWGQPVVVENRPGANGNVGAEFVARSAPDGYTLLLTDLGGLVISASVYPKLPFNPSKDFSPVVMVSYSPHVLAVHPDVQVKNVQELVAMAKAHPGKLNFAISGIGGAPQLAGIEFAQRMGVNWTYIPYKGGADAVTAVSAGQAHVLFNGMLATWPSVTGGRLRALGISSAQRVPSAKDTPTIAEQGLPGFESIGWFGIVVPAKTPTAVVARLNAALVAELKEPSVVERIRALGAEPMPQTPEQFSAFIVHEIDKWTKVVAASGGLAK